MELIITYLLATMFTMAVHMTKVIAFLFIGRGAGNLGKWY